MSRKYIIDDFSGGVNTRTPSSKLARSEASDLAHLFHERGRLRSADGRRTLNNREIVVRNAAGYPVFGVHRHYGTGGAFTLAKAGNHHWAGIEVSTTVSGAHAEDSSTITVPTSGAWKFPRTGFILVDGTDLIPFTHRSENVFYGCGDHPAYLGGETVEEVQFVPVAGGSFAGTLPYVLFRQLFNQWEPENYLSVDNRVYMTSGFHGENIRWDGFVETRGTVSCNGAGSVELSPSSEGGNWSAVKPGDTIYFKTGGITTVAQNHAGNELPSQGKIYVTSNAPIFTTSFTGAYVFINGEGIRCGTRGTDGGGNFIAGCGLFGPLTAGMQVVSSEWNVGASGNPTQTIKRVFNDAGIWKLVLDGNGPNTFGNGIMPGIPDPTLPQSNNFVEYAITRTHNVGIVAAGPLTAVLASGGVLQASETYFWRYRYKSSDTGVTGTPSPVKTLTTDATNKSATLSGWTTSPLDKQINQIEILRTQGNGATFFVSQTLNRVWDGTNWAFPASVVDGDGAAEADTLLVTPLEADADYHTKPSFGLGKLREFNNRLWASGSRNATGSASQRHLLRFSTLLGFEYWPELAIAVDEAGATLANIGGYFQVGDSFAEPVLDIIPEGGSFFTTGRQGSNLLVLTSRRGFRVYGRDWNDFQIEEAFGTGSASRKTGANHDGTLFWISKRGLIGMPSNGTPEVLSRKVEEVIPEGMHPPLSSALLLSAGTIWKDWYVLSYPSLAPDGTVGFDRWSDTIALFHIPTGTWTFWPKESSPGAASFAVYDGDPDNFELVWGNTLSAFVHLYPWTRNERTYWTPATKAGLNAHWIKKGLILAEGPDELYQAKQMNRIIACFVAPDSSQSVTFSVYANGDTSSPIETKTLALEPAVEGELVFLEFDLFSSVAREFALKFSGTFTSQVELLWVLIEYDLLGQGYGSEIPFS